MQASRYWRMDDFDGIELLRASGSRHRYARHSHEGYAIGVVEAGAHAFTARGATWTAVPGQIVVVNPDAAHDGHPAARDGSYSYRMLYVDADTVATAADAAAGRRVGLPSFAAAVVTDAPLAARLLQLHRGLELPEARLERDTLLLAILADLARRHGGGVPDDHRHDPARRDIAPALEYLREHFAEEIPLATLAELAGMDRFRLVRGFR
ncbi:MAG TPA: AraC family ligand binding domain-containing protein, partial [Gemmatimonadales bacterium]|nr:AraC family ligand binding domain-containing protein [Gemmatimonadales bacterium]